MAAGVALLCSLIVIGNSGPLPWRDWGNFALYGVGMFGVCLLACIVPTLRALRVQPTEALRAEGGGLPR